MAIKRIGILTAGGIAPCLSSSIGYLIQEYTRLSPETEILCYRYGYAGLLARNSFLVNDKMRAEAGRLLAFGGSVVGNSRVKLTNAEDCARRGLVKPGQDPQVVAAERLKEDEIDVLHTIGGDDTNTVAAQLSFYLRDHHYDLSVIGLPKTIDNDVSPLTQTLGANTAAHAGSQFFQNIVNETTTSPHMLIIHEIMGRNCGWLTVETAKIYRQWLGQRAFLEEMGLKRESFDIHGLYIPEVPIDLEEEAERLHHIMDRVGNVNLFISEGAGVENIVKEMEKNGEEIPLDAFGHVKLDFVNPGNWFAKQLTRKIGAEKTLVQKSGYFARSAAPNIIDLQLIQKTAKLAVQAALEGKSGVVGLDQDRNGQMELVDFKRIKGGKPFDPRDVDYVELMNQIQSIGEPRN